MYSETTLRTAAISMNEEPAASDFARPSRLYASWRPWLAGALLLLLVTVAYWPTLHAGFVNDAEYYVEHNLELRSLDGLSNIWLGLDNFEQYYPLVLTSFWVEYHLWGLDPMGYHVVNFLLHGASAILIWRLLRQLEVPGAWLAAAIFSLHPVHVDSVAMVHERTNTLSTVLALCSIWAYFRFAPPALENGNDHKTVPGRRRWVYYGLAFALFVAALLSKTVICSVPAVVLVIDWWKRGRLRWRDVAPTAPFFVVGLALASQTVLMEKALGASGKVWEFSLLERSLIAGRILWFYAGKLAWPYPLIGVYPRWLIDAHVWWQYVYPVAAVALLLGLWAARGRLGRGPLAAALIFGGILLPGLGFFDLFMFQFTFVFDHIQYQASIALIALVAAALALTFGLLPKGIQWTWPLACAGLIFPLGALTHQRTHVYQDRITIFEDFIHQRPETWRGYCDLAFGFQVVGRNDEAIECFRQAIAIRPEQAKGDPHSPECRNDIAAIYLDVGFLERTLGRPAEASAAFREAIELGERLVRDHPNVSDYQDGLSAAYAGLASAQRSAGLMDAALTSNRKAIEVMERLAQQKPKISKFRNHAAASYVDLGNLQREIGQVVDGEKALHTAIGIREVLVDENPTIAEFRAALAASYEDLAALERDHGRSADAVASRRKALDVRQKLHDDLPGLTVSKLEEETHFRRSAGARRMQDKLTLDQYQSDFAASYLGLAILQKEMGRTAEARASIHQAIEIRERLARENPTLGKYRDALAGTYVDLGLLERDTEQWSASDDAFRTAIELRSELVKRYPSIRDYQDGLAWCYVQLAIALQKANQSDRAEAAYRQAIGLREKLAADHPTRLGYKNNVAASYVDLGILQVQSGHARSAADAFGKAIAIREQLVRDQPDVFDYRDALAWCYADLAIAEINNQQPAKAERAFGKAIELRARLAHANPHALGLQELLATTYRDLGNLLRSSGRLGDALAAYRHASEVFEPLVAAESTNDGLRSGLRQNLAACAEVSGLMGNWSDSAEAYARLVSAGGDSCDTMGRLALAQLAADNQAGYRPTCADLIKRYVDNAPCEVAPWMLLPAVLGDMPRDEVLLLADSSRLAAEAACSVPLAAIVLESVRYRAGRVDEAIGALTQALSKTREAATDEAIVGRLLGELVLARAYREQGNHASAQRQIEMLNELIEKTATAPAAAASGTLPSWGVPFAVEMARKGLTELGAQE